MVVADLVVDRYLEVADAFQLDIENLEAEVFSPDRPVDVGRIYQLKRELFAVPACGRSPGRAAAAPGLRH
ncbi:hypothetical protein ABZ368_34025 [Streptomyces sp. NPDC005908]|uniref:hypothetical protein n=1 Tax=Streptomyces sp. NPDC005908 TaxID=3157084 RepID=UPI0034020BF8